MRPGQDDEASHDESMRVSPSVAATARLLREPHARQSADNGKPAQHGDDDAPPARPHVVDAHDGIPASSERMPERKMRA
jgi:hypothetical protein